MSARLRSPFKSAETSRRLSGSAIWLHTRGPRTTTESTKLECQTDPICTGGQLPLLADLLEQFLTPPDRPFATTPLAFVGSSFGHEDVPSKIVERFMAL